VYRSDFDGANMQRVFEMPLDFERGRAVGAAPARWLPWRNGYRSLNPPGAPAAYPQPMLSDVEFSSGGDMILGFRDRFGDMTFFDPPPGQPPGEDRGVGVGDIVRTRGVLALVNPEHFAQDAGPGLAAVTGAHDETGNGGLARVLVTDEVVTSALAPYRAASGGAEWFSVGNGRNTAREELFVHGRGYASFGEADGHGDVERLCAPQEPPQVPTFPPRTPTATRTPTPTATPTRTATPTSTPTASPSATASPSPTGTPTQTPTPTASHTATPSATSTPSPTDTATATPTRTATATRTPTPDRYSIYLPGAWRERRCVDVGQYADVVLVLDRSTSMRRSVRDGGQAKNEAAIAAARDFIGRLNLAGASSARGDQVAVVGFNGRAWLETDLTRDRPRALSALDRLAANLAEGTRLDLAFSAGQSPLDGRRRDGLNRPVMIVLTDGLPNQVPFPPGGRQEDTVLAAANAAKAAGTRVYTIGLGRPEDILDWLLVAAASQASMAYFAPDSADLAGIYAEIARREVRCR
jgi:Mg-chelatase subunit ChlD